MKLGLYEPLKFPDIQYVSVSEITKAPHAKGLFSDIIWSPGTDERHTKVAGINLTNCGIFIQPQIMYEFRSSQRILFNAIMGTPITFQDGAFVVDENSNIYGMYVLKYLYDNFDSIKLALNNRLGTIISLYTFEECTLRSSWVLPPALRDIQIIDGRATSTHKVNEYYQFLIKHSNNTLLDPKEILSPGLEMSKFLKWESIQSALIAIHNEIGKNKVAGKTKHARENVLGRRVDFSARAVAAVDPDLPLDIIKVPYKIIAKLYEPFIGYQIFNNEASKGALKKALGNEILTEASFSKIMTELKNDLVKKEAYDLICKIIDTVIVMKYPIIMKRDPSLHRASLQAFNFKCTHDNVIYTSPLITDPFNLDFDGDKVALYVPLSVEGQINVKNRMMKQRYNVGTGGLSNKAKQDISLGVFIMTNDATEGPVLQNGYGDINVIDELKAKYGNKPANVNTRIHYSGAKGKHILSYGQLLFNSCLPKKYPIVLGAVNGGRLNKILSEILLTLGEDAVTEAINKVTIVSGKIISEYPITISIDELDVPAEISLQAKKIFSKYSYKESQHLINTVIMPKVKKWLQSVDSGLYLMIESKARGSWDDIEQLLIAKGYTADGEGKITNDPIKSSLAEGLKPQEVLKMGSPTSKGSADRSLNTATTGYLERVLVFALNSVVVKESDCKTTDTIKVKIENIQQAELYRHANSKQYGIINESHFESMVGKEVNIYSPITCESKKGICQKCYGNFNKILKSNNVGINAALSLGERGSQLIMRTFHTGGRAESTSNEISIINGELNKMLTQSGGKIYVSKSDVNLYLNRAVCDFKYTEDSILIKSGLITIESLFDDKETMSQELDLDELNELVGLEIKISEDVDVETLQNGTIRINVVKNKDPINIVYITQDMSQTIKYINNLLTGRNSLDHLDLYNKLLKVYGSLGILSKHLEVLVSQMNRSASNHYQLWRRNKRDKGELIGIKTIPFKESVLVAVTYENINKAIEQGLISSKINSEQNDSPLDQLIAGKIIGN